MQRACWKAGCSQDWPPYMAGYRNYETVSDMGGFLTRLIELGCQDAGDSLNGGLGEHLAWSFKVFQAVRGDIAPSPPLALCDLK